MAHYQSDIEIEAMVSGFESCTTGKDSFSHADHLAVAVCYLRDRDEEHALIAMRESLLRFLNHHGIGTVVYNETITRFWVRMVARRRQELSAELTLANLTLANTVNAVVESFPNSRLAFEYYSEELLKSPAAKSGWVEPDLRPLL